MSGKEEYCIRLATSADVGDVFKLMKKAFFPYEPLCIATGLTSGPSSPQDLPLLRTLDNGLTAVAVVPLQDNKERIIGICIGEENTPETWKQKEESVKTMKDQTAKKFLELHLYANRAIDIWNEIKISKRFDLHHACVDPEFRRRDIALSLLRKCFEIAKSRGHTVVYSECSGNYSIKMAESLGMKCLFQMYYKDYKGEDGLPVFNTPSPHSIYKLYVLQVRIPVTFSLGYQGYHW